MRTARPVYEYIRHDEEENIEEINRAIGGLDVDIQKGDFTAVLGHNGPGKSIFAKYIDGLLMPTEEMARISGMDTRDGERLWDVKKVAGMVFQNPDNQIIGSIVEEDMSFGPENISVPTEEIWKRVEESLETVGTTILRLQSPSKPSGGQKQRVTTTDVVAMRPRRIVLDEPTAMLNPDGRREVIKTVHELSRAEGTTVLPITHYMEEVTGADRIIVMGEGRIVMDERPKGILSKVKELKRHDLDIPQVTELAYELKKVGMPLSDGIPTKEQLVKELAPLIRQTQGAFEHWVLE